MGLFDSGGIPGGLSPAGADLGLGGMLQSQVQGETEEERKRRMAQMRQAQLMGPAGASAVTSLFGMRGASGGGY